MLFHFVAHAGASVRDADPDVIPRSDFFDRGFLFFGRLDGDGGCFEGKRSAVIHCVASIHDEVKNDLGELTRIDSRIGAVFAAVQMTFNRNVFTEETQQRTLEICNERINFRDARSEWMFAAEGKQLSGQNRRAPGRIPDFADVLSDGAFHSDLIQKEIAITENRRKEIIEVVGDAAGQLAKGFHLLRTDELILELLSRRYVHEGPDELKGPPFAIANNEPAFEQVQIGTIGMPETVFSRPMITLAAQSIAESNGSARPILGMNLLLPEPDVAGV